MCACLPFISPCLQALGYLPPELSSSISFGDNDKMLVTEKITENSSVQDSILHGKVMVYGGKLSDNTPAIAKVPATASLLQQEVCTFFVALLGCCYVL